MCVCAGVPICRSMPGSSLPMPHHVKSFVLFIAKRKAVVNIRGCSFLQELHDYELDDAHHLRVSFSKPRSGGAQSS